MLQYRHPAQDENKGLAHAKPDPDAENAQPGPRLPSKGYAAAGKTPGLGQRKALGNITNTERKARNTASGLKPRRALGDITNATPLKDVKESVKKQPAAALGKPVGSVAKKVASILLSYRQRIVMWFNGILYALPRQV
jgi:hypothetical protein